MHLRAPPAQGVHGELHILCALRESDQAQDDQQGPRRTVCRTYLLFTPCLPLGTLACYLYFTCILPHVYHSFTSCLPLVYLFHFIRGGTSIWLLHGRYEELREGKLKVKKCRAGWEQVLAIKNSMYKVEHGTLDLVLQCDANPYHLVCRVCKSFAHDGICKHVLAVTHLIEAKKPEGERDQRLNLKILTKPLVDDDGKKKKKNGTFKPGEALLQHTDILYIPTSQFTYRITSIIPHVYFQFTSCLPTSRLPPIYLSHTSCFTSYLPLAYLTLTRWGKRTLPHPASAGAAARGVRDPGREAREEAEAQGRDKAQGSSEEAQGCRLPQAQGCRLLQAQGSGGTRNNTNHHQYQVGGRRLIIVYVAAAAAVISAVEDI